MESFPSVTPPTPNRAASAGPRRDPMEDSDSTLTRKRPRLDSGSASYRSMSAEQTLPSPTSHESSTANTTPPRDTSSAEAESNNRSMTALETTPSRVTINVRGSTLRATPVAHTASAIQGSAFHDSDKDELANSSEPDVSQKPKPASPNVVSPPLSPSRSPEIEVAEVEDINQEPGQTKWRILGSIPDPAKIRDDIWDMFPYGGRAQHLWETADEIARHIQQREFDFIKPCLAC